MKNTIQFSNLIAAFLIITGPAAQASTVTLSSPDGSVSVEGELVAARSDTFVLKTALGTIEMDRSTTRCDGADCPAPGAVFDLADRPERPPGAEFED
ncbi:MAG: hypothetical protein AAFU82_10770 [Pseudomonadota bacterium]